LKQKFECKWVKEDGLKNIVIFSNDMYSFFHKFDLELLNSSNDMKFSNFHYF